MTFEGKAKWFWRKIICRQSKLRVNLILHRIELIALYVHPKNSNHLRSHSRAIMALDHSRLGLEHKFSENKSGSIFCVRQVYNLFYKILLTSLGTCKPPFYTFYTSSEVKKYLEALFLSYRPRTDNNFAIQIALIQHSGRSKHAWAFTETVKKDSKITYTACRLSLLASAKVDCLDQD